MSNFEYAHRPFTHRKPPIKMAESKVVLFLLNTLWPPLYVWAWISNLDNIQSSILFIVALIMGMIRFYFWMIRAAQNKRLKDLEIYEREKNLGIKQQDN